MKNILYHLESPTYDGKGTEVRELSEEDLIYVLKAFKFYKLKEISQKFQTDTSVGWLIDKQGKLTRDISQAFTFSCYTVVDRYFTKHPEWGEINRTHPDYDTAPRIAFYKNGLYITAIPLEEADKWLKDHPLPRKGISKLTRGTVYAKYNGRCAYCGCEIGLKEMQVDHLIPHMGEGGEDTLDNYYPSCEICNRVKSNLTIEKFKTQIRHCGEIHRKRKEPIMADSDKIAIKYHLTENDHEIELFYEKYDNEQKLDINKFEKMFKEIKE